MFTHARGVHVYLPIDDLVIYLDVVIVQSVLVAEGNVYLGSHGDIKFHGIWRRLLHVDRLLAVGGHGLTQELYVVFCQVIIDFSAYQIVDGIHLHGSSVLTLYHADGSLARAEAWYAGPLAIIFQCLLDICLVIFFLHGDGQQAIHLVLDVK